MMRSSFATVCAPTLPMTWTGLTSLRMTTVLPSQEKSSSSWLAGSLQVTSMLMSLLAWSGQWSSSSGSMLYTCACPVRILLPRCIASRWMTSTETFWLKRDKPLYSKYKLGILEYGPEWEGETEQEVRMISEGLERFAAGRPEAYIEVVNGKIEEQLWSHLPPVPPVHLPDRPSGALSDSGDDQVMPPPSIIVPDPKKTLQPFGHIHMPAY